MESPNPKIELSERSHRRRLTFFIAFAYGAALVLCFLGRVPQWLDYHDFADKRGWIGIPNAANVLSNLPFIVVGAVGLWKLRRLAMERLSRWMYATFFVGVFLTGFGSWYYHANPNNETLVWDRLPLTLALTSFFSLVIGDRLGAKAGRAVFAPLVILGIISVWLWRWTDLLGADDLRVYVLVQFFPILGIPMLLFLFPARRLPTAPLLWVIGWYGLAKLCELWDDQIFDLLDGTVSGHTFKHLAAAVGSLWVVPVMTESRPD